MDRRIFEQLAELAESFEGIGITPVICGVIGDDLILKFKCLHRQTR